MVTWLTRSDRSPIAPQAVASSLVRANSLVRTRENATMLFAAVSMSLASVFALRAGFQSCSLYPVETIAPPRMEVRGVEPLSKILVAPPTCLFKSIHQDYTIHCIQEYLTPFVTGVTSCGNKYSAGNTNTPPFFILTVCSSQNIKSPPSKSSFNTPTTLVTGMPLNCPSKKSLI